MIDTFRGKFGFLSNMSMCSVVYEDIWFHTVENAYQAAKCRDHRERELFAFISPSEAKQRIKHLPQDPSISKILVMQNLLEQKFGLVLLPESSRVTMEQLNLQVKLLKTDNKIIVEGNQWHDNFWGNCTCQNCRHRPGANMLGCMLMTIRERAKFQ